MSQSSHDSDTQPSCDGTTNTSGDGASSAVPDVVDVLPNGTPARREEYKNAAVAYRARGKVNIICDSCADCAPEVMRQLGVEVIEFPFVDSDGEHLDDLWTSREPHDFYEAIRKGERVTTSAVTPGRYYDVFSRAAREGLPTVYLGFTGGLSSSIYAAESAVEMVRNEYPGFEIYVVDNLCPSLAGGLLVIEAVRQVANGMDAQELVAWLEDARFFIQGYFTLDGFDSLAAGGRIPPAAANVGGKLDIKPELSYDLNGALTLRGMCRGRKKALRAILQDFRENYAGDASLPVAIATADCEKDGDWLEAAIRKEPGCEDITVVRSSVGPVIGSHVGPGMVAVAFWGTDRRDHVSLTDRIARRVRRQDT